MNVETYTHYLAGINGDERVRSTQWSWSATDCNIGSMLGRLQSWATEAAAVGLSYNIIGYTASIVRGLSRIQSCSSIYTGLCQY